MKRAVLWSAAVTLGLFAATAANAQTAAQAPAKGQAAAKAPAGPSADEIIEKYLAAIGGRGALEKLESRITSGTIVIAMQGNEIRGTADIFNKAPNKTRSYMKMDLTPFGASEVTVDQRCDGKAGFVSNSMQGDRDVTGDQLQSMLNATFPTPLLDYKAGGAKVEVVGTEKINGRDAHVVLFTPKAGQPSREYFDAETALQVRAVSKIVVPEMGGEIEQTTDLDDYRAVDGVKLPHVMRVVNPMQTITVTVTKVEHNKPIDDAMFSKPAK